MLCYTDGLVESVDERGEMLGVEGLRQIVSELNPAEPHLLISTLVERITSLVPTNLKDDDVTIMLIRPNGASVPLRDNLLAPFRFLSNLASRWT